MRREGVVCGRQYRGTVITVPYVFTVGATLGRPPMPAASFFPAPLGRRDVEDAVPYDWKMFNHDVGAGLPDGPARSAKRAPATTGAQGASWEYFT